jgi:RNA polymerase sigma factor (TIGR02999 family)
MHTPASTCDSIPTRATESVAVRRNRTLTTLLEAWRFGDGGAFEQVIEQAHAELAKMAAIRIHREPNAATVATGDLLNEAIIRVMEAPKDFKNRAHFFATMSLTMRNILVDYARARQTDKRGAGQLNVTFTESVHGADVMCSDMLALDEALTELETIDERGSQVVQLAYFGGLSRGQIADVLTISVTTVDRELKFARAWLFDALKSRP